MQLPLAILLAVGAILSVTNAESEEDGPAEVGHTKPAASRRLLSGGSRVSRVRPAKQREEDDDDEEDVAPPRATRGWASSKRARGKSGRAANVLGRHQEVLESQDDEEDETQQLTRRRARGNTRKGQKGRQQGRRRVQKPLGTPHGSVGPGDHHRDSEPAGATYNAQGQYSGPVSDIQRYQVNQYRSAKSGSQGVSDDDGDYRGSGSVGPVGGSAYIDDYASSVPGGGWTRNTNSYQSGPSSRDGQSQHRSEPHSSDRWRIPDQVWSRQPSSDQPSQSSSDWLIQYSPNSNDNHSWKTSGQYRSRQSSSDRPSHYNSSPFGPPSGPQRNSNPNYSRQSNTGRPSNSPFGPPANYPGPSRYGPSNGPRSSQYPGNGPATLSVKSSPGYQGRQAALSSPHVLSGADQEPVNVTVAPNVPKLTTDAEKKLQDDLIRLAMVHAMMLESAPNMSLEELKANQSKTQALLTKAEALLAKA
ncbi:hypothetical protein HDE_07968 [Halotydeus destructor]|nr:hypothetical protein HDE_07968 [Halotydeus destructor]